MCDSEDRVSIVGGCVRGPERACAGSRREERAGRKGGKKGREDGPEERIRAGAGAASAGRRGAGGSSSRPPPELASNSVNRPSLCRRAVDGERRRRASGGPAVPPGRPEFAVSLRLGASVSAG